MKYLLDTHTFLWMIRSPDELPQRAHSILANPASELLISMVVPWEMAIKFGIGKLREAEEILRDFESLVSASGFVGLETSIRHVIQSGGLPLHHRDPFDRLLVAQSFDLQVPIISRDDVLDRYGVARIWN